MRDTPEERQQELWEAEHPVGRFERLIDLEGTLKLIWSMYKRQKAEEADAGREVSSDVERMSTVFNKTLNRSLDSDYIEREYPDTRDRSNPLVCYRCDDKGWYYSHKARFSHHGRKVEAPGMVVCSCPHGHARNKAIAEHGRRSQKKRPGRDFG